MTQRQLSTLIPLFLLAALGGCFSPPEDPWYRPVPDEVYLPNARELPDSFYYQIDFKEWETAVELLQDTSAVTLTTEQAQAFARDSVQAVDGLSFYLVRGLALSSGTGGFYISVSEDALHLHHSSLGHAQYAQRLPVIVQLKRAPSTVYVSYSGAI